MIRYGEQIVTYDVEASALEGGYPIEIGVATLWKTGSIETRSWLIRPPSFWLATMLWSDEAERLHGLTRANLEALGLEPAQVCRELNWTLDGATVLVDSKMDGLWTSLLFAAGEIEQRFQIRHIEPALGLLSRDALRNATRASEAKGPAVHRAALDARRWAELLRDGFIEDGVWITCRG